MSIAPVQRAHAQMLTLDIPNLIQTVLSTIHNFIDEGMQVVQNGLQEYNNVLQDINNEINKLGFKNTQKKQDNTADRQINAAAALEQEKIAQHAREQNVARSQDQVNQAAKAVDEEAAAVVDVGAALCRVSSNQKIDEAGGAPGEVQSGAVSGAGTGRKATPNVRWGGGSATTNPTSTETTREYAAQDTREVAGAASNNIDSPGARGAAQFFRDVPALYLNYYCDPSNYFGRAGQAGVCKNPILNRSGLDTQAADLLSGGKATTLLCFADEKSGKITLGKLGTGKCPAQTWESIYGRDEDETAAGRMGAAGAPVISLGSAYIIRDYLAPAPLDPFSVGFLRALGQQDQGTSELFTKRQGFNAQQSILYGVIHQAIARRTPQKLGGPELEIFQNNYMKANPSLANLTPELRKLFITQSPSQMERRDVMIESFRRAETNKENASMNANGIGQRTLAFHTENLVMQRDILYTLERIEMLLTAQLSNDLRDKRDALQSQVQNANSRYGGASENAASETRATP